MVSESKKMAIINITCDYPNTYSINQLAVWANVSGTTVEKLSKELKLDVYRGKLRQMGHSRPISGKNFYFK